jgi:hypothetical protein
MAGPKIEHFKRELARRGGAGGKPVSDAELLREALNKALNLSLGRLPSPCVVGRRRPKAR